MHIDCAFLFRSFSFCISYSLHMYLCFYPQSPFLTLACPWEQESVVISTFQTFYCCLAAMGNILFKVLFSRVVVNILFFLCGFYHFISRWQYSQGSLVVVSVQKPWTAAFNDKRCILHLWVHFICRIMFQPAQKEVVFITDSLENPDAGTQLPESPATRHT